MDINIDVRANYTDFFRIPLFAPVLVPFSTDFERAQDSSKSPHITCTNRLLHNHLGKGRVEIHIFPMETINVKQMYFTKL